MSKSHSWDINQVYSDVLVMHFSKPDMENKPPECGEGNQNVSAYDCKWQPTLKRYCSYHFFSCKGNVCMLHPFLCSIISGRKCSCQTVCSSVISLLGPQSEKDDCGTSGMACQQCLGCAIGKMS